jgi:hypothetical protein
MFEVTDVTDGQSVTQYVLVSSRTCDQILLPVGMVISTLYNQIWNQVKKTVIHSCYVSTGIKSYLSLKYVPIQLLDETTISSDY